MTTLTEWAVRHGVTPEAIAELVALIKHDTPDKAPSASPAGAEQYVQTEVRLEASATGCRLWRNNVGACKTDKGAFIRYGLCNDSQRLNSKMKSSDLIGIRPVFVKPEHIGHTFGVFLAREVKHELWKYTGTPREAGQRNFLELVIALGGDASFATGRGTI